MPSIDSNVRRQQRSKECVFSDEATFHLNRFLNKHNIRYWCETNPHVAVDTVMNPSRLKFWYAVSKNRLIGHFSFEDDIIKGENYWAIVQSFFIPEVRRLKKVYSTIFRQNGAPPHFAINVRPFLNECVHDRWIGSGSPVRWAPRSTDLMPLDFFFWGHMKNEIYKIPVNDMSDLKERTTNEIKSISKDTLSNIFSNILKRMNLCISVDSDHFEHLL